MSGSAHDLKFPGLAANRELIEKMLNTNIASRALKEYYNQEPENAVALLSLQLDHTRLHVIEQNKKAVEAIEAKKKAADLNPQPVPSGGGTPTVGGEAADDVGSQIVKAKLSY